MTTAPDPCRTDLHWFIEGSVVDAQWSELTVGAVALVVVSRDDELVAFVEARLPANICTAPAAEASGLMLAATYTIDTPQVVASRLMAANKHHVSVCTPSCATVTCV